MKRSCENCYYRWVMKYVRSDGAKTKSGKKKGRSVQWCNYHVCEAKGICESYKKDYKKWQEMLDKEKKKRYNRGKKAKKNSKREKVNLGEKTT